MKLEEILKRIDENQQKIAAHGAFNQDLLNKVNYKLRLDWNYYSNRMEGGTLTREETRSVMVGNIDVSGKPLKDVMEMNGHNKMVLEVLKMSAGTLRISEKRIKEIHAAIMYEEDDSKRREIGNWKSVPNEIINYQNEKIDFILPSQVPDKIHSLLNDINAYLDAYFSGKAKEHPIAKIAQFHIDFLTIHPFYDGNGRTARVLTNVLLMACKYPIVIIKEEHKTNYYRLLADIQVYNGSPDLLYTFLGERIIDTQSILLNAIDGKEIDEPDDIDKRVALLDRLMEGVNESIQKTKNEEVMQQMFTDLVEPLFRKVFEKCLKISSLFTSSELAYFIDGSGSIHGNIDDLIDDIEIAWLEKRGEMRYIQLQLRLEKLKKLGLKAFDEYANLQIEFEKHKYRIVLQDDDKLDYLYHQIISSAQMEEISSRFINIVLTRIEMKVDSLTKK